MLKKSIPMMNIHLIADAFRVYKKKCMLMFLCITGASLS